MDSRIISPNGMVVTPHHLASQTALAILKEGGNAIEATIAAAATISVVYPHMNGIGGDSFWLILPPEGNPIAIDASGPAGCLATAEFYNGEVDIPIRGPKSASTVAGTIGGWIEALNYNTELGFETKPVERLLADAIKYAEDGFPVSSSQVCISNTDNFVTHDVKRYFMNDGKIPEVGERLCLPELARTLRDLAENGLDSFYRGDLAKKLAADFELKGMPIRESDLTNYKAVRIMPLKLSHSEGEIYNLPPSTQGLVSLSILGILDKLDYTNVKEESEFVHLTVEATKQAFKLRDMFITDPKYMKEDPQSLIAVDKIVDMAKKITDKASNEGKGKGSGDTIWMGIMDSKGYSVSFIQSVYHAFGSGVVLPKTGILWQNRGTAFNLERGHILHLEPGKKPFHTLNPAAAKLKDGRIMVYGTRGGDGQPQTQAVVFHRYVIQKIPLQESINSPRWIFGRGCDDKNDNLSLEGRFDEACVEDLKRRGHNVVMLPDFSQNVGHAGAIVRHMNGMMEGASDPRSDGSAVGF